MSKSNTLLNEVEQEVRKNKAPSWVRLMLMLIKALMKEMRELREFVNSPDADDLDRRA